MSNTLHPKARQDMIDKVEIGELQNRYMFALDWWDADVYAGVFTEDGILSWPEGHAEGREAIRATCVRLGEMYRRQAEAAAPTKMAHKHHFVSNRVIRIDGDQATALCYWFDFNNDNQPRWPYVQAYGYYEDELIRTSEGWRFTKRRIYNEMSEETPLANPGW